MPELPEVEAVAERLRRQHLHRVITACGQFRPTTMQGGENAIGHRIAHIDRRGKHLLEDRRRGSGGPRARRRGAELQEPPPR